MDFNEIIRKFQEARERQPETFDKADEWMETISGFVDQAESFLETGLSTVEGFLGDAIDKVDDFLSATQENLDARREAAGFGPMSEVAPEPVSNEDVEAFIRDLLRDAGDATEPVKPETIKEKLQWLVDNNDIWNHMLGGSVHQYTEGIGTDPVVNGAFERNWANKYK